MNESNNHRNKYNKSINKMDVKVRVMATQKLIFSHFF